jgi:hypothetical protein
MFYPFENKVSSLLRNQSKNKLNEPYMNVGVLLENGEIKMIERENEQEDWKIANKGLKVPGKILKIVSD